MRALIQRTLGSLLLCAGTVAAQGTPPAAIHYVIMDSADMATTRELRQPIACHSSGVPVHSLSRRLRPKACALLHQTLGLVARGRAAAVGLGSSDTGLVRSALATVPLVTTDERDQARKLRGAVLSLGLRERDYSVAAHYDHRGRFIEFTRDEPLLDPSDSVSTHSLPAQPKHEGPAGNASIIPTQRFCSGDSSTGRITLMPMYRCSSWEVVK